MRTTKNDPRVTSQLAKAISKLRSAGAFFKEVTPNNDTRVSVSLKLAMIRAEIARMLDFDAPQPSPEEKKAMRIERMLAHQAHVDSMVRNLPPIAPTIEFNDESGFFWTPLDMFKAEGLGVPPLDHKVAIVEPIGRIVGDLPRMGFHFHTGSPEPLRLSDSDRRYSVMTVDPVKPNVIRGRDFTVTIDGKVYDIMYEDFKQIVVKERVQSEEIKIECTLKFDMDELHFPEAIKEKCDDKPAYTQLNDDYGRGKRRCKKH